MNPTRSMDVLQDFSVLSPRMTELPRVQTMTLEVTHRCHRRCRFCYLPRPARSKRTQRPIELTAQELVNTAHRLQRHGCEHVQLSGGEPLLREDCVQIVEGLRRHGMKVSMLTDGGPLNAGLARALFDQGLALMQPTLLAGQADLHDSLRGAGAFSETTRAIATAAAAGLGITVSMVLTRRNWDQVQGVAELSFALGARGLTLSRFCPASAAAEAFSELMPSATQVRTASEQAAAACRRLGLAFSAAITIPHCVWEEGQPPPPHLLGVCGLMGDRMPVTVGPDGAVRSCSLSSQPVGSVLEDSWPVLLQRLWGQHLLPARESRPTACRTCSKWKRCLGGCRLSARATGGDFSCPDPLAPVAPLNEEQRTYGATTAVSDGSM